MGIGIFSRKKDPNNGKKKQINVVSDDKKTVG